MKESSIFSQCSLIERRKLAAGRATPLRISKLFPPFVRAIGWRAAATGTATAWIPVR